MQKSPSAVVKEKFGDKAKLVAALGPLTQDDLWLSRVNEKKGLGRVSNAKLLRLHRLLSEVKEKFGTRTKLVDAVCDLEKRAKDEGYKQRLLAYPVPRLYDLYRALAKRTGTQKDGAKARAKAAAGEGQPTAAQASRAEGAKATAEAKPTARAKAAEAAVPAKKKAAGSAKTKSSKS